MATKSGMTRSLSFFPFLLMILFLLATATTELAKNEQLSITEDTVLDIQLAFKANQLTSRHLVQFYVKEIHKLNPILKGVLEINPDALEQADRADRERKSNGSTLSMLHGIPVLVKDNIATKDKLNTTAGSYALLGSVVPIDAGVVTKLRTAEAIILGKATLSEWSQFRSREAPSGWSARTGKGNCCHLLILRL